ncbi:MAG: glycoside hydrolase family 38 C-terminal domain-containing protein [Bacteroidales bacterium]|nr:glycoside hydrolase family 38 C-terminal domain-containing protein [Bacteroidales bacterium]
MRTLIRLTFILLPLFLSGQCLAENSKNFKAKNQVTDIVVVFKMHVDIGYTNWAEGVLQKYCNEMLEETLKSIDETSELPKEEQFVWTIPAWPLKYMLENCSPDKKKRLEKAIKDQRIVPHALPVTFETEASDLENLVRGLSYSSEINRAYGLPPARDAKLTDVPSHSRILPTLLKNAGIDFLHLGCNPGSASPDVPTLFWWQGPDGSKLLTFYWAEYYGSGILPPKDWPHKTWLAMIHTHENSGAPSPEEVANLLKAAKEEMPDVNIKIGRLSDFYDLLMKEDPNLPIVTEDMPDTWIHGYMSNPRETRLSKYLQRETYNTETLNLQLNQWGITNNSIEPYISNAVENMVLYDEHTFGAAMTHADQQKWTYGDDFKINKSLGNYDFIEGTWHEKGNRIKNAEKIIVPLMKNQLKQLASSVKVGGKRIVVYNSLPWTRSGRVNFFAGVYQKKFKIYGLKDATTGKVIPVYEDCNLISFDADSVPSLGYKTYIPVLNPITTESSFIINKNKNILENQYFSLHIDKEKGTLSSVYDKQNKREIAGQNQDECFGQYFLERPGQEKIDAYNKAYVKPGAENWANDEMIRPAIPNQVSKVYKGSCEKIVYLDMGNAIRATIFGKLDDEDAQRYLVSYTLYENRPYVEIVWGVDGKAPNSLPEAGWLAFPFNIDDPEYRLYRTGGIVDPQRELIEGSNHDFYFLNTSMSMFDKQGNGVVLNCPESPGISIDKPGLFQFSGKKQLTTGTVFVNLYNNQWGTNFTEWIEGSFSSKMYIWSYQNYDSEESFITPSEETRNPLHGVFYEGDEGNMPLRQKGISLSQKGILLTAFGKNRDGDGTILRLWEQSGNEGVCRVSFPKGSGFTTATPCNLRGEAMDKEKIEIADNSFSTHILANQPVTFILK